MDEQRVLLCLWVKVKCSELSFAAVFGGGGGGGQAWELLELAGQPGRLRESRLELAQDGHQEHIHSILPLLEHIPHLGMQ